MGKRGNVQTITNPLDQVTTSTAYDLNGRPTSITDPNGVVTTLTYHPRGWVTSRTVGGETTTYTYDNVGQLTKVTMPDGSYVQYTYDGGAPADPAPGRAWQQDRLHAGRDGESDQGAGVRPERHLARAKRRCSTA